MLYAKTMDTVFLYFGKKGNSDMMPTGMRYCLVLLLVNGACTLSSDGGGENPPSPGFDLANSDPAAVELADSVMEAMGGRENWDNTRFISWRSEGQHEISWDKRSGRVRIESFADSTTYLFHTGRNGGRVQVGEREILASDSLTAMLREGRQVWLKDSFRIVMPFTLKGDGLTLKYLGEERTDSARYNLLQISISGDGPAPAGRFLAFVDLADNLIKLYAKPDPVDPAMNDSVVRIGTYEKRGTIMLPSLEEGSGGPGDVQVHRRLPSEIFEEF